MNYEKFTDRARRVMQLANQQAQKLGCEYIGTEHILLGLSKEGSGVAANVLKNLEIHPEKIIAAITIISPAGEPINTGKMPQTPRAKAAIEQAIKEAEKLNHNYVGTEHLLLGLIRADESGTVSTLLRAMGVDPEEVCKETATILGHFDTPTPEVTEVSEQVSMPSRDLFAAIICAGICTRIDYDHYGKVGRAQAAVEQADALLDALENFEPGKV